MWAPVLLHSVAQLLGDPLSPASRQDPTAQFQKLHCGLPVSLSSVTKGCRLHLLARSCPARGPATQNIISLTAEVSAALAEMGIGVFSATDSIS